MTSTLSLPGQRSVSVDQALALASDHYAAGRLAQAEALALQVTRLAPRDAFAWQLLGILAHASGKTERGVELMGQAIRHQPLVAQFYANRGEMQRKLGLLDAAVRDGRQAVKLDPQSPAAHSNLGIALYHLGRLDEAEAAQQQALRLAPDFVPALNNLGSIRRDRRDLPAALAYYRRVLALDPLLAEAANNLGATLVESEQVEQGLALLREVARRHPRHAEAHNNMGNALLALEDLRGAEAAFREALRLAPGHVEALEGLARCAQERREPELAEQFAREALARRPRPATHCLLGSVMTELGRADEAAAAYETALALKPDLVPAWLGKGHLHLEFGRLAEAEDCFRKAQALDPDNLSPRLALAQVRTFQAGDADLAALEAAGATVATLPPARAAAVHYALGKALDDTGHRDEAFGHFLEGARLKRGLVDYSADHNRLVAENIARVFTPERLARLRGAGHPDAGPIFVLGMPRSGTTLTETILASHPDVSAGGELPYMLRLAGLPRGTPPQGYPLNLQHLGRDDLGRLGERYIALLRRRAPGARRVTDKMPANFLVLGLIHLMLPNAKVIHVRRHPVDTCLSAFTRLFSRGQHHSYDLRELGLYYLDYLDVMAHWRAVLPAGSFHELDYEALVTQQEAETRRLLDFCGLDWHAAVLQPHRTERHVKTASVAQVRKPVYTSSVERRRTYEHHLGPLLEALGDALPPPRG